MFLLILKFSGGKPKARSRECVWQSCLREDGIDAVALSVVRPLAATSVVQTPRARLVAVFLSVSCENEMTTFNAKHRKANGKELQCICSWPNCKCTSALWHSPSDVSYLRAWLSWGLRDELYRRGERDHLMKSAT